MDVLKKIGNVFGIIFAVVFSVVLTIVLLAIPVVSAASSFTQGETLHQVMEEIDYSEVITSAVISSGVVDTDEISSDEELSEDVVSAVQEQGISSDIVEDIMSTDAVGEVLDLYMDDAFAMLEGNGSEVSLTPEALQEIAGEHMDELVVIAKDFLGEDAGLTDEQVTEFVNRTVEEHADTIIEMLPPVEELLPVQQESVQENRNDDTAIQEEQSVQEDTFSAMSVVGADSAESALIDALISLRNGSSVMSVILIAVVLSLLILLCRIMRFKGFMWLGVVYLISAGLTLLATLFVEGSGITQLFGTDAMVGAVITPVLTMIADKMRQSALVIAICAVVFIVVFAVGRVILKKKAEGQKFH